MRVGDSVRLSDLPAGAKFSFQANVGVYWRTDDKAESNGLYLIGFYESNLAQRPFPSGPLNVRTLSAEGQSMVLIVSLPKEYRKKQRQAKMAQGLSSGKGLEVAQLTNLVEELRAEVKFHKTTAEEESACLDRIDKVLEDLPGENFDTAVIRIQAERDDARALNRKSDQLLADIVNAWVGRFGISACERCWRPSNLEVKGIMICNDCYDAWGEDYEGELP